MFIVKIFVYCSLQYGVDFLSKLAHNLKQNSKKSLGQKIAKTEKEISKNREQYERLTVELEELHKNRRQYKVKSY